MEKVSDYEIISAETNGELTTLVKERIKKGWQPYGNAYACHHNIPHHYQPMVKYEEQDDKKYLKTRPHR